MQLLHGAGAYDDGSDLRPAQELAARLVGLRFERSVLQQKLNAAEVNNYFDGVSSEVLLDLILGN